MSAAESATVRRCVVQRIDSVLSEYVRMGRPQRGEPFYRTGEWEVTAGGADGTAVHFTIPIDLQPPMPGQIVTVTIEWENQP